MGPLNCKLLHYTKQFQRTGPHFKVTCGPVCEYILWALLIFPSHSKKTLQTKSTDRWPWVPCHHQAGFRSPAAAAAALLAESSECCAAPPEGSSPQPEPQQGDFGSRRESPGCGWSGEWRRESTKITNRLTGLLWDLVWRWWNSSGSLFKSSSKGAAFEGQLWCSRYLFRCLFVKVDASWFQTGHHLNKKRHQQIGYIKNKNLKSDVYNILKKKKRSHDNWDIDIFCLFFLFL